MTNEILIYLSDAKNPPSTSCLALQEMSEDIIERWPHSIPFVPGDDILRDRPAEPVSTTLLFLLCIFNILYL